MLQYVEYAMNQSEDRTEMRGGRKGVIFGFSSISYYAMIRPGMRWLLLWEVLYRIFLYGPLIRYILFLQSIDLLIPFPLCTSISYRYGSARSSVSSLDLR